MVDWISDKNGNVTSFSHESTLNCDKCRILEIRDPLGRITTVTYGIGTASDLIQYKGENGTSAIRTITVNRGLISDSSCAADRTVLYAAYNPRVLNSNGATIPGPGPSLFGGTEVKLLNSCYSPLLVKSLQLPNGDTYSFLYNDYAELAKVTLPTGSLPLLLT